MISGGLMAILGYSIASIPGMPIPQQDPQWLGNTVSFIGIEVMTQHLLAFEAIGILLLAALIGAINIAAGKQG